MEGLVENCRQRRSNHLENTRAALQIISDIVGDRSETLLPLICQGNPSLTIILFELNCLYNRGNCHYGQANTSFLRGNYESVDFHLGVFNSLVKDVYVILRES